MGGRIGTRTAARCRGPGNDLPDNRIYRFERTDLDRSAAAESV